MKIPSFRYMGGKARLRKWLLNYFPKSGRVYVEPFAGVGNVFFAVKTELNFQYHCINEPNSLLLRALQVANLEELPQTVTREEFEFWKHDNSPIAKLIEPRVTFAGKGYASGYSGSSGTHVGYEHDNYYKVCKQAQELIKDVHLYAIDYLQLLNMNFTEEDFIYLDPPYFETKANYPNINHNELVNFLNNTSIKWALSGYDNKLYQTNLKYENKFTLDRNSEIKSSNTGQRESAIETLWTNY